MEAPPKSAGTGGSVKKLSAKKKKDAVASFQSLLNDPSVQVFMEAPPKSAGTGGTVALLFVPATRPARSRKRAG
jgi:hypothetical protein